MPDTCLLPALSRAAFSAAPRDAMASDRVVFAAAALVIVGAALLAVAFGWRQSALYLIGATAGFVLFHASFGFASAWRAFIVERRGAGVRAQIAMLALATALFFPVLDAGVLFGRNVAGAVAPVGVSVAVGAVMFGIGMQLGGGCASGTLYAVGGGSTRMLLTLAAFIAGAVLGTAHLPWWLDRPSFGAVSFIETLGLPSAFALQGFALAALAAATIFLECYRHGRASAVRIAGEWHVLKGPWPLLWGAVALALVNFATLAVAGHPWSITFAFSLWGAKVLDASGVDVASWTFWTWPFPRDALASSIFADSTSVMNFGLIAGAALASGLAGRFAPALRLPVRSAAAAIAGGLLMGYGARLAFGCNIGALFSGIASGSLHGWLWLGAAFLGSIIGTQLRRLFVPGVGTSPTPIAKHSQGSD